MKSPFSCVIIFVFIANVLKTRKQSLCNIYKTSAIVINAIDSFEKSVKNSEKETYKAALEIVHFYRSFTCFSFIISVFVINYLISSV